jgi:dienelactone hydrolase
VQDLGYSGLSFRELAKNVGIKSASIHYYFATKGELGAALASRYTAYYAEYFDGLLAEGLDPETCMARYTDGGKPVTIFGQLRIAQGAGRLPVVVLQHGSSGYAANIDVWSREFNELGISTFAIDAFIGRGLTEVNSNQALLGRLNLILDIYRALDVLASHPRVDPGRIVLMGVEFAAYVPFYPDCMTTFISDTEVVDRPIRIFGGTLDDYNPISVCKAYVERLRAAGRDVELTEYPSASHAFDNPLGAQPAAVSPTFESARNCKIREEPTDSS